MIPVLVLFATIGTLWYIGQPKTMLYKMEAPSTMVFPMEKGAPVFRQTVPVPEKKTSNFSIEENMKVIVSLLVLVVSLFIAVFSSKFSPDASKWAFTTIGTIVGYWLK
jgi:hypothetical protein